MNPSNEFVKKAKTLINRAKGSGQEHQHTRSDFIVVLRSLLWGLLGNIVVIIFVQPSKTAYSTFMKEGNLITGSGDRRGEIRMKRLGQQGGVGFIPCA